MVESEIDRGIFVSRTEAERTAFHQLIDRYISEIAPKHKGAYSEIKRLEALKRHPLATRIVAAITSSDFARYRDERLKIRKGNTVKRELALFQCVIEVARREWGIHLPRIRSGWSAVQAITTSAHDDSTQLKSNTSSVLWSFVSAVLTAPMPTPLTIPGYGPSSNWRLRQPCAVARFSSCAGSK
ncbi:Shufflon-specific recombinase [Pseudomonas amygdali pv. photiniae]|uniref:Shufflon-specific recombinase n=1 Tax=Pseudomonas amygdali pv. photiniae TaxID=251724 RepID=A0A0P9UWY2_PSEA0|nr:hypothetical protein [Pseudomonas amygdali]KPC57908.1 Integrase family protein [Pseudomonas amygdali pv. morsprunorum]KPX75938.1 Shufflon-specific recombinase [Pseudomonas amygdali pv. photiniae]RMS47602.1 Shufflon-specific recombinase [Pseudomonas amygdali pv. photiniae]